MNLRIEETSWILRRAGSATEPESDRRDLMRHGAEGHCEASKTLHKKVRCALHKSVVYIAHKNVWCAMHKKVKCALHRKVQCALHEMCDVHCRVEQENYNPPGNGVQLSLWWEPLQV